MLDAFAAFVLIFYLYLKDLLPTAILLIHSSCRDFSSFPRYPSNQPLWLLRNWSYEPVATKSFSLS
jgi:hypothetical protein